MVQKIKAFWSSLPHQVQAGAVAFGSAAFVTVLQNAAKGEICSTWQCVHQHLSATISSGATALLAFYMKPNRDSGQGGQ